MKCPRCQYENPPEAKFCRECGTRALPTGEPHFGSPDAYTPAHLAERILISKAAVEGERKQVTVLFADLKGSMELSSLCAQVSPTRGCLAGFVRRPHIRVLRVSHRPD